jgi:hypothetical protein
MQMLTIMLDALLIKLTAQRTAACCGIHWANFR